MDNNFTVPPIDCEYRWDSFEECGCRFAVRALKRTDEKRIHYALKMCVWGNDGNCTVIFEDNRKTAEPMKIQVNRATSETKFL
jgi:hypothetical protein